VTTLSRSCTPVSAAHTGPRPFSRFPTQTEPAAVSRPSRRALTTLTSWSFVCLQYRIRLSIIVSGGHIPGPEPAHLVLASLTRIRARVRSSFSRWLCSFRRRSLSSDMESCRPGNIHRQRTSAQKICRLPCAAWRYSSRVWCRRR
jgi:hypothetical protein